ncbi:hypothetical protein M878_02085 [Streptomyces roseochromogenus subsp. oscitans DS 12.976]|uniref:Uncharacterized protein n=1 Tax=Streptomyces roseochromogenus subsp. oscitans DS 12.976 TaxID=1352936 RepID=V6KW75_STRRC|nr:hypothetical protein M878_02085 [Streptomyces roseochromogenus subsp. oscitans DS 12.976]
MDRAFGDEQVLGDGCVVVALRHELQQLPLTRGQRVQGRVAETGEEFGGDLRVQGGVAGRDPLQGVENSSTRPTRSLSR